MNNLSSNRSYGNKGTLGKAMNTAKNVASSNTFKYIMLVILVVILIVVIYFIFKGRTDQYSLKNPILIDGPTNAFSQEGRGIVKRIPQNANPFSFSYSLWIYVSEWNEKEKYIIQRGSNNNTIFLPSLRLGTNTNDLTATISTTKREEQCNVANIPLQKWVHIVYVLNNRTVDIYVNGKLERSCVLEGIPLARTVQDVAVVPNGGFFGQISRVQYFSSSLEPVDVERIYLEGPYDGKKYDVKFFEKGNIVNIDQRY